MMSTVVVHNPSSGELIDNVPSLSALEVRIAIQAAEEAGASWAALTAKARAPLWIKKS